jgi:ribulose 1,5-bisphosphate synthetase/thiazole synthase
LDYNKIRRQYKYIDLQNKGRWLKLKNVDLVIIGGGPAGDERSYQRL